MIDGRLLVPSGALWAGAALAAAGLGQVPALADRHDVAGRAALLAAAVAIATTVVAVVARTSADRSADRAPKVGAVPSVVIGVVAFAGGLGVAAAHVWALTPDPLATWVDARATATVRGVIATEPVVRLARSGVLWAATGRQEVRLASDLVTARGRVLQVSVPLILRLPPDAEVPPPGTAVEVVGRLAGVPARVDAAAAMTVRRARAPGASEPTPRMSETSDPGRIDVLAHAMRTGLREALSGAPADGGALVAGLAVGDESMLPDALAEDMRASGLSHLTAVSGGNVAILLVAVLGIAHGLGLPLLARVAIAAAALGFFVVLVGPQPSVLRAGVMGAVVLMTLLSGGRGAGPSVLATSVLALVAVSPSLTLSWGFALSVIATGGLVLLSPRVADRLARWRMTRRWPPAVRQGLALTGAAQAATLPLLIAMGAAVGWVALPANLLAMPAVAPVTVLGLVAAAVAPLLPGPAAMLGTLAAWPAGWIAGVAHSSAALPLARLPWPEGWLGMLLLVPLLLVGVIVRRVVRARRPGGVPTPTRLVGVAVTLLGVVGWTLLPPGGRAWPPPGWLLIMCDVGQGDALLLHSGDGSAVVVDAGPDPDLVDRCLDDAEVSVVPAIVLTHFHADHVNGLLGVFRGRSVGTVLVTPLRDPPEQAEAVDEWLDGLGRHATTITAGDERSVGGVSWRALWPRRRVAGGSIPNNASVVLAVAVSGREVLLSGDIESEAQAALARDLAAVRFDVVKVPHHGSEYQSPLLTSWAPAGVALVSVGADNPYGHPSEETLAGWRERGALVARTDRDGDVAVVPVGSGVGVVARHGMLPSS